MLGLSVGETTRIEVPHEELRLTYDRAEFEEMVGQPARDGMEVHALTGLLGEVVALDERSVTLGFDPERSGQPLTFDVEVFEIE